MPKSAFPLRLCPFEEYLLLDDRPLFPMNFFLRLTFEGKLCPDRWKAAISEALVSHPLLNANIEKVGSKRIQWTTAKGPTPQISFGFHSNGTHFDLEQQTGLRISLAEDGRTFSLLFQIHHSCCDGQGACQFINDVLLVYARNRNGAASTIELKNPSQLKLLNRARFGLTPLKLARLAPRQLVGLKGARQFMMRKPQPLSDSFPVCADDTLPLDYPATITHRFNREETREILRRAKHQSVTLNDLIVRDLLIAIDNHKCRVSGSDDHWLRLTVPVSLRDFTSDDMPATNIMSLVFLDRRRSNLRDPNSLLLSLNEEMNLIKRNKLGLTFVLSLAAVRSVTGSLAKSMPSDEDCLATAVLTNPGVLFKNSSLADEHGCLVAGDNRLIDVEFMAPFRPNTHATFSAYTYAEELRITTHFDQRSLGSGDAQKLHSTLIQRLGQSSSPNSIEAVNVSHA